MMGMLGRTLSRFRLLPSRALFPFISLALVTCGDGGGTGPGCDGAGVVSSLTIVSGDHQAGPAGLALPSPVVVRAADPCSGAVTGQLVDFQVTEGGGLVTPGSVATDGQGRASVTWRLGTSASDLQKLTASTVEPSRAQPFEVVFSATATAGDPAYLSTVAGDNQMGEPGVPLDEELQVRLVDKWGNPVAGVPVEWNVYRGGGSMSPPTSDTDEDGIAASSWTLGPVPGLAHGVEAKHSGASVAIFQAEAAPFDVWQELPPIPIPVRAPAAATDGSLIYVIGGSIPNQRSAYVQIFDPARHTWSTGDYLPVRVDWAAAAELEDRIHVLGGVTDTELVSNQHWIYDPAQDSWSAGPVMPQPAAAAAIAGVGGKLYVMGGIDAPGHRSSNVQVYDGATGAWTVGESLPTGRTNVSGAVLGDRILLVGGGLPGYHTSDELLSLDLTNGGWTQLPAIPTAREAHGTGVSRGVFCAFGGRSSAQEDYYDPMGDVACYDPDAGGWTVEAPLAEPLAELRGVSLGAFMYSVGGRDDNQQPSGRFDRIRIR